MKLAHLNRDVFKELQQSFALITDNSLHLNAPSAYLFDAGEVELVGLLPDVLFEQYLPTDAVFKNQDTEGSSKISGGPQHTHNTWKSGAAPCLSCIYLALNGLLLTVVLGGKLLMGLFAFRVLLPDSSGLKAVRIYELFAANHAFIQLLTGFLTIFSS